MTHQPKDPAILSDPLAQAWRKGELKDGPTMTPQSMTQDAPHIVVRPCFDATGKHRTSWDICYRPEPGDKGVGVIASCYGPREQAEQMASALCNQPQMPVLMSQEWLDQKVAADPDSECEVRSTIASDTEAERRRLLSIQEAIENGDTHGARTMVGKRLAALTKGNAPCPDCGDLPMLGAHTLDCPRQDALKGDASRQRRISMTEPSKQADPERIYLHGKAVQYIRADLAEAKQADAVREAVEGRDRVLRDILAYGMLPRNLTDAIRAQLKEPTHD